MDRTQLVGTRGGEQGVHGEVDREVGDDAHDGSGDAGQGCGDGLVTAQPFDVRAPRKMNRKQGVKVTQVVSSAPIVAATQGLRAPGCR